MSLNVTIFKKMAVSLGLACSLMAPVLAAPKEPVVLKWLQADKVSGATGVSWGVPWPRGTVKKGQTFTLSTSDGRNLPVQTWPMAYWPDGSLKWSGFATVAGGDKGPYKLSAGKVKAAATTLRVQQSPQQVRLQTGALACVIPRSGAFLLDSLRVEGRLVGSRGRLEAVVQAGPDGDLYESPLKARYLSQVTRVTVEQAGPVRAVVRVEGQLQAEKGQRSWLPFSIRLYFYAGSPAVRLVNTIIYDGNDQQDFIRGLGLVFQVPMREQLHNRHVRFSGEEEGLWAEPIRPLVGRRVFAYQGVNVFPGQVAGKRVVNQDQFPANTQALIKDLPIWNDYKLLQHQADGFNIQKRTNASSAWIDATAGRRASGLAFIGDVSGGLSVGLKDFWQSYPAALEVRQAATDLAELRVWLWSPYAEAMDMRHYDTLGHGLEATYEDYQPGLSTPYGVARTSELTLFAHSQVPSHETLRDQARLSSQPPLLVASPEYLHAVNIFGAWSLPDRSTPGKRWIEDQLDKAISFYQQEIDQRNWYGFWNYGDVMHSYDAVRHNWRYDVGGFAWANTELSPDMWLWYSFLRTGRADIFRMAEAMTRHTSEVDVYHLGPMAGLGSRHNVRHWGCGSKEVRESQAAYRRFFYYLTTDERTGDMMREVAQTADAAMVTTDPLRLILPKSPYPTHSRIGPDWLALVGNWMTEWERTGDKKWRDYILAGVNSFAKMPYGFFSGQAGAFGYDPATKQLFMLKDDAIGAGHLTVLMGGPEIAGELAQLLNSPAFNKLWLQYARLYGAPADTVQQALGKSAKFGDLGPHYARLPAYVAKATKDPAYARLAWEVFLVPRTGGQFDPRLIDGVQAVKPLQEVATISTNNTAQWCLNAMQLLALIGDQMPAQSPLWE